MCTFTVIAHLVRLLLAHSHRSFFLLYFRALRYRRGCKRCAEPATERVCICEVDIQWSFILCGSIFFYRGQREGQVRAGVRAYLYNNESWKAADLQSFRYIKSSRLYIFSKKS